MVTQNTTKGLEGSNSISRRGSALYSLTLDEVQSQFGNLGKTLGTMNLDELLTTIRTSETEPPSGSNLHSSFSLSQDLSKKTVEEIWREIQHGKMDGKNDRVGEMTLEDFLNQAGVIVDSDNAGLGFGNAEPNAQWIEYQMLPQNHQALSVMPILIPNHNVDQQQLIPANGGQFGDSGYLDMSMSPSNMILSDTQPPVTGRKRVAPGEIVEKTVERRHKRMIKNRESAARSRARKQAYTHELEIKISLLEEENERLQTKKEAEMVLPSAPLPEPKYQLRRTSSAPW